MGILIQRAVNVAIRRGVFTRANPFSLVEKPRLRPKETSVLTIAQSRRFLELARDDRFEALWVVLVTSGLRLGEALALYWDDLDLLKGTLSVRRSLIEVHGSVEIGPTKTPKSRRRIELGKLAVEALKRRKRAAAREEHQAKLVFPTTLGTPMRRGNLRRSHFLPLCAKVRVTGIRIHDLRHGMASLALAQGVSAKVVAERLGHSTTRLTVDRYSHVLPTLQREAADAIDAILKVPKDGRK